MEKQISFIKVASQPPFLEGMLDKKSKATATTGLPYGYVSFFFFTLSSVVL